MTKYKLLTPSEAARESGVSLDVQTYQAGEWVGVESVTLSGKTVGVRFAGGGTSVAPAHFFSFRISVPDVM